MTSKVLRSEEHFIDLCPCSTRIFNFVDSIKDTDVRWFFEKCYFDNFTQRYTVIFKSYVTEEYNDYILSVEAKLNDIGEYDIRIVKKIDNLLNDIE